MTTPNLSRLFRTYPRKRIAYPDLSKTNWIAFEHKKGTYPGVSCSEQKIYIGRYFFLFNCKNSCLSTGMTETVVDIQRTHPVLSISEVSCGAYPKALRDSRHLKKQLVPRTFSHPSVATLLRAVLVTSHNELYVISPAGSYRKVPMAPFKHKEALCDILGRYQLLTKKVVKLPPYYIPSLIPRGEK